MPRGGRDERGLPGAGVHEPHRRGLARLLSAMLARFCPHDVAADMRVPLLPGRRGRWRNDVCTLRHTRVLSVRQRRMGGQLRGSASWI